MYRTTMTTRRPTMTMTAGLEVKAVRLSGHVFGRACVLVL